MLPVPAGRPIESAQRLARTIPGQFQSLSSSAFAKKRRQLPPAPRPVGEADADDLREAVQWLEAVSWTGAVESWLALISQANVLMRYNPGTRQVGFNPSLAELAARGTTAREWAGKWSTTAPLLELDVVRGAGRDLFVAVSTFYSSQVAAFQRFTNDTFEDGSAAELALAWQDRQPRYIAALTPIADRLRKGTSRLNGALAARQPRRFWLAPSRR